MNSRIFYGSIGFYTRNCYLFPNNNTTEFWQSLNKAKMSANTLPVQVNLHVQGKKMASAMIPHLSSAMQKGAAISSTTGVNISLTPIPTAYNTA